MAIIPFRKVALSGFALATFTVQLIGTQSMAEDLKQMKDEYWKEKLTPEQYHVCREGGTERAFTGKYYDEKRPGMYNCSSCGAQLFSSETKFDSGTGWPSFWEAADPKAIELHDDFTLGMHRTEVRCAKCGAHLGHLFNDGPNPTGKRFCINSVSLVHEKDKK